jgi:hypothetical protein
MTTIGKLLAFVNLLVGVAMVTWSVSLYTQRPGWFDPKPESVGPGQSPASFALLKDEIDSLGRAATGGSANWGAQRNRLEKLEKQRATRLKGYAERINWATNGKPGDPNETGFFAPVYDSATGLIDLTRTGAAIVGPDNKPLRGAGKLGKTYTEDVDEVVRRAKESTELRTKFASLGTEVAGVELRVLKMGVIRDAVQSELLYLGTFELNVYETRQTVLQRKRQLAGRLAGLGVKP